MGNQGYQEIIKWNPLPGIPANISFLLQENLCRTGDFNGSVDN